MPYATEAFGTLGETVVLEGRAITAEDVHDADILAIRSTTKVDRALLDGSSVKFIGTATTGMDHLDTVYLDHAGIEWCCSPGCNANSVSEYIMAALLCLANRHGFRLAGKTIGVIGVGHVGSLVVEKANSLGMRVMLNDPLRQKKEKGERRTAYHADAMGKQGRRQKNGRQMAEFVDLRETLAEADIITLHVSLTREGPYATFHMADETFFAGMKPDCIFLNSARGAVVDTDALLTALDKGRVRSAVIDTWEGEPAYNKDLLERVDLGTPHIAGYSFDGKVMGTMMVYREVCKFLGREPSWTPDSLLPLPAVPELEIDASPLSDEKTLWTLVRQVYDIESDDHRLRHGPDDDACHRHVSHFDHLRRHYPVRREYRFTRVILKHASVGLRKKISGLGFAK